MGMLILIASPLTVVSAGEFEVSNVDMMISEQTVEINQEISGEGAVCTGYDVKINEPGEYSNEVNLTVTKGKVTWSANPGYVITGVCVKEGGQGGGTLYTPDVVDGEYTKQNHDISHAAISWDETKQTPSVKVSVGSCVITGETTTVTITITGASVTVTGPDGVIGTYSTSPTTLNLPAGSYSYTYTALAGYEGTGSGAFNVSECPYATVSVTPGICEWNTADEVSTTDVVLTINNATLTLTGPSGVVGTYSNTTTVPNLEPGQYSYNWTGKTGYQGSGSGTFTLITCEPGTASASVSLGSCSIVEGASLTPVTITLNHASLTINGVTYTENTTINLEPGSYDYTWEANEEGYTGEGSGTLEVEDCTPKEQAEAEVIPAACKWNEKESESLTEVAFTLSGASLTITSSSDQTSYGPFTESGVVALPAGSYTYSWTAVEGFTGSGEGNFTLISCEPGVASASVVLGSCGFADGTSLTPVTISLNQASLTLNGVTYTEGETIEMKPGTYPYTWEANEEGYSGQGSGTLVVDSCEPKENPPVDPKPDVAAGGNGPSLIYIMAPATIGITSLGLAWTAIKKKWMDR